MTAAASPTRIEFVVRGTPRPQPRIKGRAVVPKSGKRTFVHFYTPGTADEYREAVLIAARRAVGFPEDPWTGGVRVTIEAFFKRTESLEHKSYPDGPIRKNNEPDADNVVKSTLDALTPPKPNKRKRPKGAPRPERNLVLEAAMRRGYLWVDDGQVHLGPVDRWWCARGADPGVIVIAERIPDEGALFQ